MELIKIQYYISHSYKTSCKLRVVKTITFNHQTFRIIYDGTQISSCNEVVIRLQLDICKVFKNESLFMVKHRNNNLDYIY